jgi:DNA mismatch endonuclease (patch repair protein)
MPKSNADFWKDKIARNRLRDLRKSRDLRKLGYRVLTVWGCQAKRTNALKKRLATFLDG